MNRENDVFGLPNRTSNIVSWLGFVALCEVVHAPLSIRLLDLRWYLWSFVERMYADGTQLRRRWQRERGWIRGRGRSEQQFELGTREFPKPIFWCKMTPHYTGMARVRFGAPIQG
jgi:hypothetical protein